MLALVLELVLMLVLVLVMVLLLVLVLVLELVLVVELLHRIFVGAVETKGWRRWKPRLDYVGPELLHKNKL